MFKLFSPFYMDVDEGSGSSADTTTEKTTTTVTPIDWSTVDVSKIPEEVVKKHTAYTKVLDESIQRRQKISELRKLTSEEKEETKTEPIKTDVIPVNDFSRLEKIVQDLTETIQGERSSNLEGWRKQAAEEYGLKGNKIIGTLTGKSFDEVMADAKSIADELGIPKPVKQPGKVGNATNQTNRSALEQAKKRMNGTDAHDVYGMDFQRSMGGGYVDERDD